MRIHKLLCIVLCTCSILSKEAKGSLSMKQGSPLVNRRSPARAHTHQITQPVPINTTNPEPANQSPSNWLVYSPSYTSCTACLKTICTTLNYIERTCRKHAEGPQLYEMTEDADEQRKSAVEDLV